MDAEDQLKMIGKAKGGATHGGDTLGAELAKEHDTFVRALEKEFKFKAHHWEPVREGVISLESEQHAERPRGELRVHADPVVECSAGDIELLTPQVGRRLGLHHRE